MCSNRSGSRFCRILIILIVLNACFSSYVAAADRKDPDNITYDRLKFLKQVYPDVIYRYCTGKHKVGLSALEECLHRQAKLADNALKRAQDQFGMRLLAQFIYDECLARNSAMGVGIIAACVDTRIMLNAKIGDLAIEKMIFQDCDAKWLRHGYRAVHNCCLHAGNHYRRFGEIKGN